ncbi:MAG: DsbE family thiol:disulfide interchange protein [Pseudomonadota bacterium]
MKIKPLALAPPLLFAALAGLFLSGTMREDPGALPSTREGQTAPALALDPLEGKATFTAEDLAAGDVKLLNFWASWCAPCRVEHPNLALLAEEGIPLYGVNYKDDPDHALAFLEELGDPYAGIGADPTARNAFEWGVSAVPETFVLGRDGQVILRFQGPVTQRALAARIRPAIEEAMR